MPAKKDYVAAAHIVAGHRQRGVTSEEACRVMEDAFVELFRSDSDAFHEVLFRTACRAKPKPAEKPAPKSRRAAAGEARARAEDHNWIPRRQRVPR